MSSQIAGWLPPASLPKYTSSHPTAPVRQPSYALPDRSDSSAQSFGDSTCELAVPADAAFGLARHVCQMWGCSPSRVPLRLSGVQAPSGFVLGLGTSDRSQLLRYVDSFRPRDVIHPGVLPPTVTRITACRLLNAPVTAALLAEFCEVLSGQSVLYRIEAVVTRHGDTVGSADLVLGHCSPCCFTESVLENWHELARDNPKSHLTRDVTLRPLRSVIASESNWELN